MPPLAAFLLLVLILAAVGEFVSVFGLHHVIVVATRLGLIYAVAAVVRWVVSRSKPGAKG